MSSLALIVSAPLSGLPLDEPSVRAAFACLLGEFECARCLGRSVWDFPVALPHLQATGLSDALLRALIDAGCVEHRIELTHPGGKRRRFLQSGGLRWHKRSCFALTPAGADLARQALPEARQRSAHELATETPYWDAAVRDLWHRRRLVKHFRRAAPNQEYLLDALQELGWVARIDDPLPRRADVDPQDRLRDTVKSLNRSQDPLVIHFEVEVTGRGVRWRVVG
jgi:hypothetical protein